MKKPITIISSISIALFLTALIAFGTGLYIDKKHGSQKADARYEKLLSDTKENFFHAPYGTKEFANSFIRTIGNIDDFSSLKLEVNGSLVYSYPPTSFSIPSPELVKSYKDTVQISEGSFTLKASIYLMHPSSIYKHSRFAFLLILIGTIIAGIFIVFYNGTQPDSLEQITGLKVTTNKQNKKTSPFKKQEDEPEKNKSLPSQNENLFAPEQTDSKKEVSEPPESANAEETAADTTDDTASAIAIEETPDTKPEDTESQKSDEISISFPDSEPVFTKEDEEEWNDEDLFADSEEKTEEGLDIIDQFEQENKELSEVSDDAFITDSLDAEESNPKPAEPAISPVTHLQLQSSLEQKLDEELENGSQFSLALVRINALDRGNEISKNIISILQSADSEAVLFEYKADSYAILLNDTSLQNAVDNFEEIYNKIADFLKASNAANEVSIGISSVSGRKIHAERIILEASQALDYASQDPDSPIVAFRANPDKYREFEESQS